MTETTLRRKLRNLLSGMEPQPMVEKKSPEKKRPAEKSARFSVGELVHHVLFNYRGVVIDVDMTFSGTDEYYEKMAPSRPPKEQPWYRILVNGASHETYVAERNLEPDREGTRIQHPDIDQYFGDFARGRYIVRGRRKN